MNIQKMFNEAVIFHQQNKFDEAKALCEKILIKKPKHADALHLLGVLFMALNQNDKTIIFIKKAISINPQPFYYSNLGTALSKQGKNDEAIKMHEKAITLNPNNAYVYYNLGNVLESIGKTVNAIAMYEKVITLSPNYANVYYNLGNVFKGIGKTDDSIKMYEKAIALNPNYVDAYNNLGNVLEELEKTDDAIAIFEKVIALNPNYADAYNNLGLVFKGAIVRDENNLEMALKHVEKALSIEPARVTFILNKAAILNKLGCLEEAEKIVRQALEIEPKNDHGHFILGLIYQNRNRLHDANSSYLKSLEFKSDSEQVALALATNYYLLLNYSATHEFFKRALPLLNRPELKEFKAGKIYVSYIGKLLNWWETEIKKAGLNFNEQDHDFPILAVIGESHSLAAHRTHLNQYCCRAHWIEGIKMWHLAQTKLHPMKSRVIQILNELPTDTAIMFTIGEIDARPDEGIWQVLLKKEKNLNEIIDNTVGGYIEFLYENLKDKNISSVTIQGIPAPNYALKNDKDPKDEAGFLKMIKQVNDKLKELTLQNGWNFLDVYSATVGEDGKSNTKWHIDGYHLQPLFYTEANKWLIKPEVKKQEPIIIDFSKPLQYNLSKPST